jgi:hypothetical protein
MSHTGSGGDPAFFHVRPNQALGLVEAWSGYQLQFETDRKLPWQKQMAAELRAALARLVVAPGEALTGAYLSTSEMRCDVENRLFTNPGQIFPRVTHIRFERGVGAPPEPPVPISKVDGHLHYYRYRVGGSWDWWQPAARLASWPRVPVARLSEGNARPVWLAMKRAAAAGRIRTFEPADLDDLAPFGIRITVHASTRGPRVVLAISESLIDGTIAAFHAGDLRAAEVAAVLALRMPASLAVSRGELEELAALNSPGPIFQRSPFSGPNASISPSDERCYLGEVEIRPDARGKETETSGELFALTILN